MSRMPKPMAKDVNYFMEPCCDYPTMIRLAMDDGQVLTYVLLNKTDYQFMKVKNSLDRLTKMTVGYQYRGRHKRSLIHNGSCEPGKTGSNE